MGTGRNEMKYGNQLDQSLVTSSVSTETEGRERERETYYTTTA